MTAADLVLHGARLLTLAPLREERPRVGPAAGDVGAVMDGFVAARDGAIVATGHGAALQAVERVEEAVDIDVHSGIRRCGEDFGNRRLATRETAPLRSRLRTGFRAATARERLTHGICE